MQNLKLKSFSTFGVLLFLQIYKNKRALPFGTTLCYLYSFFYNFIYYLRIDKRRSIPKIIILSFGYFS